ncbi:MAG: GntR family transcriptional regulator [Lachnospiraceae bacterium]|nr:GntR family transcriptional regulator [Lachnospiraceae bacterium]
MEESGQIKTSDKYSLQGRVFDRLREDILNGVYKENDELKEMTIGAELGVSRTPVREALRQLELEGLVKIIPNKGAYVIGISSKDLKDIYEMRASLEGLCARWATKNAGAEDIAKLDEISDLAEFHLEKKKYDKVLELDNEFHELLYHMADSKMLYRTLSGFHHYLEIIRKKTLSSDERVRHSIQEHRDIIDSLRAGDAKRAEQLAILHMENTIQNIEEHNLW